MKALLIIANEGYQDIEYSDTREQLEKAGIEIIVAALKEGQAKGKMGGSTKVNKVLKEINVEDYDVIVFIGGPGAIAYQKNKEAQRIAKEADTKNRIIAAICIAPTILAYAGVLKDREATTWDDGKKTEINILKENGAQYKNNPVIRDKNCITANGPHAAKQFGKTIVSVLSE